MRESEIIVIGRGNVGGELLRQLQARGIRVTASIDLKDGGWETVVPTAERLKLVSPIVVDATAADDGEGHADWIARGWRVVTANKKPISGPLALYDRLISERYFHETTVGAGLPVIHMLKELLETGDEIIEIKAALSGTMGFIFSECGKGRAFAEAVADAKAHGFTEPDPRDDLRGTDIARKALILARMLGQRIELHDIRTESLSDGMDEPSKIDARFAEAAASGLTLRYLATVTPASVQVGIEALPPDDPFAGLHGPENLIRFRTKRYDAVPLTIRGPGAGAAVTAGGIFGDILRASRI